MYVEPQYLSPIRLVAKIAPSYLLFIQSHFVLSSTVQCTYLVHAVFIIRIRSL